ncbi:MAG TPA: tetratricopeptide repeat protein [Tepidisphaeraceae bacterium]|jgi:tetratricopeptide (TPR) repeat protein|nr:tetratricopeptide repeat protein [Tepidisphaeraceae bacterium]
MARRVNTRFLVILTIIVVVGSVGAFTTAMVVKKLRNNPEKFTQQGRTLMAEQNWDEASRALGRAYYLSQRNPEIPVLLGEVHEQLAAKESDPRELIGKSRGYYQASLEIDARYLPALRRLMDSYKAEITTEANPGALRATSDVARKILAIEPNDHAAIVAKESSEIRLWMGGVPIDGTDIDVSIAALIATTEKNPTDADPVQWVVAAYSQRARDALRVNRSDEERSTAARKELDALATYLDKSIKGQEDNAAMALRAAQGYAVIDQLEADPQLSTKYSALTKTLLAEAQNDLKPTDPLYTETRMAWAGQLQRENDKAGTEQVLRELIAQVPYEHEPKLALVGLLSADPAKREEAIKLLTAPLPPDPNASVFDRVAARGVRNHMDLTAANLRVMAFGETTDAKERARLKSEIDASLAALAEKNGEDFRVLRTKGKFQVLQGQYVEAVATLNRALSLVNPASGNKDYDLLFQLGRAYSALKQTGEAKATFLQIVDFGPARLQLAQLYLADQQAEEASAQLDVLERMAPDAPELARMRFQVHLLQGKRDQALALFAKMPQTTREDHRAKAQAALALGDRAQAITVLEAAAKAFPGDVDVAVNLAQLYGATDQKDKAIAAVEAGLATEPENQVLQMLKLRLSGESREEVIKRATERANQVTDPYTRALQLAELERSQGNLDQSLKHLAEAEQAKPGSPDVADIKFQILLSQRKFDEAAKEVPTLVKANRDSADGLVYRFRLAMAQGKVAEAESIGLELTTKMPNFAQSWICHGQAQQAAGKHAQAIDKYTRALERQNNNLDAFKGLIDCYYQVSKPDEAERYIARARRTFPNDAAVREAELAHQQNYGNPLTVLPAREQILKDDPETMANWQSLAGAYVRAAQFNASRVDGKKESEANLAKASELLTKAVAKWPAERSLVALKADVAMSMNDVATAEKVLNAFAAREEWKDKADPQLMLAELYARTNRLDEAEDAHNVALKRSNNAVEVRQRAAAFLANRGKVNGAIELLPASDPNEQVRRQLINILSAAGRFKEAEEAVKASLTLEPDSVEMQALLASTYLDQSRYDDALKQVETVLKRDAKNQMALYVRGLVRMRQPSPDPDAAINDLSAVSDAAPRNVDVRVALADAYRMRNDSSQAIRVLSGGVHLTPSNKPLRLRLLDLYVSSNMTQEVDGLLREASTLAPLQADPEWLNAEANAYAARGDFDKAASRMKSALAAAPNNANLTSAYINLLIRGRNQKAAIAEADKVLATADVWWAHQYKAIAKKALNDRAGAVADLTAALRSADAAKSDEAASAVITTWADQIGVIEAMEQLQPRLDQGVRWKLLAASLYLNQKDYANARTTLESAMAQYDGASNPEQIQLLRFAGAFYLSAQPTEPNKAQEAYDKLLQKTPDDMAALNNIACLLAESVTPPQPERALGYSSRAYEQLRRAGRFDPMVYDTQGWILVLSGKVDEGIDLLRQVVNRAPFMEAHYHLGEGYLRMGTPYPEEAERQLTLAIEAYEAAASKKQSVDPALKARIESSLARAKEMMRAKDGPVGATGAN